MNGERVATVTVPVVHRATTLRSLSIHTVINVHIVYIRDPPCVTPHCSALPVAADICFRHVKQVAVPHSVKAEPTCDVSQGLGNYYYAIVVVLISIMYKLISRIPV